MVRNDIRLWAVFFAAVPVLAIVIGDFMGLPF